MKKLLLGALALTAVVAAQARTLSPEEALQRALSGASSQAKAVALTAPELVAEGSYKGSPSYYVFSNDKAAVIVSASSLAAPVIGSLDHPVTASTPMPEQLKWWLGNIGKAIAEAEAAPQSFSLSGLAVSGNAGIAGKKVRFAGNAAQPRTAAKTDIAPLLSVYWDQGNPYNLLCPTSGSARCYTGCVATATAMVMKHYTFPEKGTGTVSTSYNGTNLTLSLSSKKFDWANMLNSYTSSATTNQKNAVAYLMQAVGYAVKMNYGTDASGALTADVPPALINNFGYDQGIDYVYREFYTNEAWEDLVYAELQAKRPIIYGGHGSDGGHQFICDGYRVKDGFFHFNWGWSGAYDGYYALSNLVPSGMGAGGNSDGFTQGQDMLTGVRPAVSGSVSPDAYMGISGGKLTGTVSGRRVTLTVTNDGAFRNCSYKSANFDIGYTLTDQAGTTTGYSIYTGQNINPMWGFTQMSCSLPSNLANGTYSLVPVYRINGKGSAWLPMKNNPYYPQYVIVTVNGTSVTVEDGPSSQRPGEIVEWEFDNASSTTGFVAGSTFDLSADVTNPNGEKQTKKLVAVILDKNYYIQGSYKSYIRSYTLDAGQKSRLTFNGEIDGDVTAGEYIAAIIDPDTNVILVGWYVNVETASGPAGLRVTSITTNPTELVIGDAFKATLTVSNTSSSLERATVSLHFCQENPDNAAEVIDYGQAGSTSMFVMGGASGQTYDVDCTVPSTLTPGEYILAAVKDNSVIGYVMVNVVSEPGAVTDITVDDTTGDAVYYDLQGRPVTGTPAPGLYLRRQGTTVTKVTVK